MKQILKIKEKNYNVYTNCLFALNIKLETFIRTVIYFDKDNIISTYKCSYIICG